MMLAENTAAQVHVFAGEKETREILGPAEAIRKMIPESRPSILPGLYCTPIRYPGSPGAAQTGGKKSMICNLGNRVVNNYLISSDAGLILIDTGYAGGYPRFLKRLEKNHVRLKDIRYVFLTHAHDDHAGFLNEVLAATDAQVILHPKAIEGLKRGQNSFQGGCSSRLAYRFCKALVLFGHGSHRYPPIRDEYLDRLVPLDSERFKSLRFPYAAIETPGHTADHISLLVDDALFCGDAAMNGFPSRKRTIIWIEDLAQYKHSWKTILQKAPAMIYPAHGKPFRASDLQRFLNSLDGIKLRPL